MYLMPAATRSDVTVLSPVCPRQAGAQTFGGVSTDRERFGGTGAEHHGRFDESDRAVHNNVACLLLLHKATTAPASSLLGPQDAGAVVLARASQAKWRRSCFTSTAMSRRAVRQSQHVGVWSVMSLRVQPPSRAHDGGIAPRAASTSRSAWRRLSIEL